MDICLSVSDLISPLVTHPHLLKVEDTLNTQGVRSFIIRVSPSDMRKVIGNSGKIFRSIRTIVRSALNDYHVDVTIDLIPQDIPSGE